MKLEHDFQPLRLSGFLVSKLRKEFVVYFFLFMGEGRGIVFFLLFLFWSDINDCVLINLGEWRFLSL